MVDDDIATIFNTVAQDIAPDLGTVIAEATRQGRRRRARRRIALAVTAATSVVAIAVAATVAAHLASRTVHGSPPAGPAGHRHARPVKPKAHHHTPPAVPQAHGPGMKPSHMLAVLRKLLPPGTITYVAGAPFSSRGSLELNFDDGNGAVDIMLNVDKTVVPPNVKPGEFTYKSLSCPHPLWTNEGTRPAGALPISCVRLRFADGAVERDAVMYADGAGFYGYDIYYTRPDGITVFIQVGNGTLVGVPHLTRAGWPYVDRARPPGSMALWRSVVESPKWHL